MARIVNKRDISQTLEAFRTWSDKCLIENGSLFSSNPLWTPALIEEVREAYVDHPDLGARDFISKLQDQMKAASPGAKQLMAEMLWVLLLFPSNVSSETKRQQIRTMWEMSGERQPTDHPLLSKGVLQGIGSGGPGFNNHRWRELVFLIELTVSLKQKAVEERRRILSDYDAFINWLGTVPQTGSRQFRHMLRFFTFPDRVERMSSNSDRRRVLEVFGVAAERETRKWSDKQLDEALFDLRAKYQGEYPSTVLDFYEPPLRERWRPEDEVDATERESVHEESGGSEPRVWVEKTIVHGRADRQTGEYALGKMLWSPQRSKNGADVYRFMREVRAGDYVLHLTDNEGITGRSQTTASAEDFNGLPGTPWADRLSYRIPLRNFERLEPPLSRDTFFSEPYRGRLVALLNGGQQNLFYNSGPSLNQGAYLTPASKELVEILDEAYQSVSGNALLAGGKSMRRFPQAQESVPEAREDLAAITEDFASSLHDAYLDFGPTHLSLVRAFIASLAAKPFVILTGLSGSGKSQIAIKFGQWLGSGSRKTVAVRPDWTGPEALFGYEDVLRRGTDGRQGWHVPEALEFMLRAAANPRAPYALVLDEMNLAHVERYFADALSGMETVEPCLPNLIRDHSGTWVLDSKGPSKLAFPRNLFVIGTVNVDETTYLFSPKVLDRANTFEFRVSTQDLSATAQKPVDARPGDPSLVHGLLAIATRDSWHLNNPPPWLEGYTGHLRTLHQLLGESSLEFGHRVYYEAVRFAAVHSAAGQPAMEVALDRQILQKILPRIHGARKRVEASLCALGQFCQDLSYKAGTASSGSQVAFDPTRADLAPAVLPLSFDKVRRMVRTVRANQFTSFTD